MSTLLTVLGWWCAGAILATAVLARIGYTLKKTRRSPR